MKKIFLTLMIILSTCVITGCTKEEDTTLDPLREIKGTFITVKSNEEGKIIIDTENITNEVTFANYEVDGVIIQFLLVRGTDGIVRIAFNTCQACNPSPNAYFIQKGEYLECQNCLNRFHIDRVGIENGGCNPTPVEEKEESENQIIIDASYADSFKEKFEDWNGPTS